jgi:hypothetical protein
MKAITSKEYLQHTGIMPRHDDLERCNCLQVGRSGHEQCGWCDEHELPRFMCGLRSEGDSQ